MSPMVLVAVTYPVQMERVRSPEICNLSAWDCEFDDVVFLERVNAARGHELLGRSAAIENLQQDRHFGRLERGAVDVEAEVALVKRDVERYDLVGTSREGFSGLRIGEQKTDDRLVMHLHTAAGSSSG